MTDLPAAALLGFSLAASPGPVNALAVVRGLRYGAAQAFFLAAGAGSADVLYATVVVLGAGPLVSRPGTQVVLAFGGGAFLAQLAIANLRAAWGAPPTEAAPDGGSAGRWAGFRQGFTIALLSPLTIVFWMSVFGGFYADSVARGSRTHPASLVAMLLLGANVWTCVVAALIHYGRRALSGRGYRLLVTALSLVLFAFAVRLFWSGARTLLRMA